MELRICLVNRGNSSLHDLLERLIKFGGVLLGCLVHVIEFTLNFGYGLEKELADVSADRGIARRDAVGGQEDEKFSQDVVYGSGGAEVVDGAEEFAGENLWIVVHLPLCVLLFVALVVGAEGRVGVAAPLAATPSECGDLLATIFRSNI